MHSDDQVISQLECFWDRSGLFGQIRSGRFDVESAERVVEYLLTIQTTGNYVNKRIVSLLWYIPLFLEWNRERVVNAGRSDAEYRTAATRIEGVIQSILGLP